MSNRVSDEVLYYRLSQHKITNAYHASCLKYKCFTWFTVLCKDCQKRRVNKNSRIYACSLIPQCYFDTDCWTVKSRLYFNSTIQSAVEYKKWSFASATDFFTNLISYIIARRTVFRCCSNNVLHSSNKSLPASTSNSPLNILMSCLVLPIFLRCNKTDSITRILIKQ